MKPIEYKRVIAAFGLSIEQLQKAYPVDEEGRGHPDFDVHDWVSEVREGRTLDGYWMWLHDQIREVEDDLIHNNPYNNEFSGQWIGGQ